VLALGVAQAGATVLAISNEFLAVTYDTGTSRFLVESTLARQPFVQQGRFSESGGEVHREIIGNPIWGAGQSLAVTQDSGNVDRITLYPHQRFAFIQTTRHNGTVEPVALRTVDPLDFEVLVGRTPADELALRSSGALTVLNSEETGSYTFLALANSSSRAGVVCGWLTHERGSGIVFAKEQQGKAVLRTRIDYGALLIPAGQSTALETFLVGCFEDARLGLEAYADTIARNLDIKLKPKPVVYCTWYNTFRNTNEKNLARTVDLIDEKLADYGLNVVQIDDGWQAGIELKGPARNFYNVNESYASGMKASAEKIKAAGLTAGIWFMPFSGTVSDPWFADKQDLFATMDGKPYNAKWGGDCLDMTNPAAQAYLRNLVQLITREWGYKYLKLDGLWTGTATRQMYINTFYSEDGIGESKLFNPAMTHIEAYRAGLGIVREEAGEDVFILGCNISQNMRTLGASFGLVDAMRIGPDNRAAYPAILKGPLFGARLYFLHDRVWHNDPDPAYVRETLGLNDARLLCSWIALTGLLSANSVDYNTLPADRLDLLRRTMPTHSLRARPADFFDNDSPSVWLVEDPQRNRSLVGLFNWGKSESDVLKELERAKDDDIEIDKKKKKTGDEQIPTQPMDPAFRHKLDWIGLDGSKSYVGFEYWSSEFIDPFTGVLERTVPARTCQIISLVEVANEPQVIGTSRSISQGAVDLGKTEWDAVGKQLQGASLITRNDPYEIRMAAMKGSRAWKASGVSVSKKDRAAGVKIEILEQRGWKLRVQIESPENREVHWTVQFN
jgi:hypothetical protein